MRQVYFETFCLQFETRDGVSQQIETLTAAGHARRVPQYRGEHVRDGFFSTSYIGNKLIPPLMTGKPGFMDI